MASVPYVVEGVVRKGPKEGYVEIDTTVGGGGGDTVNVYVSDGTELATSQTVTIKHISSDTTLSATTDDTGQYAIDLADLGSYSEGDAIAVIVDTRTSNDENLDITHLGAKAYKVVLVDKRGKEYDEDYPYPIVQDVQLFGHPDVRENCETSWTITRSDGQPDSETVTLPDSTQFQRTFSYDSDGFLTNRSRWNKI